MTTLTLAPWECDPSPPDRDHETEQAVHSIPWNGELVPILFQTFRMRSRPYVFARHLESRDEGNWLVCDSRTTYIEPAPDVQTHIANVAASLRAQDGDFSLARFCVVSEELFQMVEGSEWKPSANLFEDGRGEWLADNLNEEASFGFSMDWEAFRSDGEAVARFLEDSMRDPNSDIAFARRWAIMEPMEKAKLLLQGESNQKQLEAVMRWTLLCEPSLWQKADGWFWIFPGVDLVSANVKEAWIAEDELPFVFRMRKFLLQQHIPGLSYPLWEQHRCTRDFSDCGDYPYDRYASAEVSGPPSAHERMEAHLQLRDWLKQNAYPHEIEAIGPF